jgi:glutamate-ammonia-ligase adenylyltransferase
MASFLRDTPRSLLSTNLQFLLHPLAPETAATLLDLLETCPDLPRVQYYLRELEARFPGLFDRWRAAGSFKLKWLLAILSSSRFLSEELVNSPNWLDEIPAPDQVLSVAAYRDRLGRFLAAAATESVRALDLAMFRRREILRVVLRDALSLGTVSEITEELSNLADAIMQRSLCGIMDELSHRYGKPSCSAGAEAGCGFTVIALGKLGGRELNYSSDIDLMFLYRENGETSGPDVISNREYYKKVANRYTELLSTYTPEGLCYRVDLRLRPEGKLGEICISLDGAKQYYARRARDWELQMLIKARVVAGDVPTGEELLRDVEPLIYSTTTDFSTIETMSVTRERLAEKLLSKRLPASELDVKLMRGGIRDIEFLVQCLQRLHGGRDRSLRHGGTLYALSRLLERDVISRTEHSRLSEAYEFLRHVEHRLQFEEDRQTHTLPSTPEELDRLAVRMPVFTHLGEQECPGTELLRQLNLHLENVQVIYGRIVHAQRPLSYAPLESPSIATDSLPSSPVHSSDAADGDSRHASDQLLGQIEKEAPMLAETLRGPNTIRNAPAFEAFWDVLKDNKELLKIMSGHPGVTSYVLQILNVSPFLAGLLTQDISLLHEVRHVADHPNRRSAFEGLATPLNDVAALRRFFRREMFRILTASICVSEPIFQTLDRTSALAEFMIARAYRIALERSLAFARAERIGSAGFAEPENEMMVIALGRLGMREFDLGSDADLLFIIPNSEVTRQKFWTRVAEHVIEILTSYTGDTLMLSIDTRLRPNGREGLLVQTESTFTDYFAHHSEAWEGIAYMKARAVAGDMDRAISFLTELQEVDWRRWGQSGRSKQDLKQMRLRLEREQGNANPLKAGRGGYYDADFALMYLRLKGAGLFFKSLNTRERIDIVEKMGHLERSDAEFLLRASTFYRAVDHALRIATGHAEGKLPGSQAQLDTLTELVDRWTDRNGKSLEEELTELSESMRRLFERLFA